MQGSLLISKWALGFSNSQWGLVQGNLDDTSTYDDPNEFNKELAKIINTYRKKGIPIDNFIFDFDWKDWGGKDFGDFKWNSENFPDSGTGKLQEWKEKTGITFGGIFKPRIIIQDKDGNPTKQALEAERLGYFTDKPAYTDCVSKLPCKDLDFSKQEVRHWFWEEVKDAVITMSSEKGWSDAIKKDLKKKE